MNMNMNNLEIIVAVSILLLTLSLLVLSIYEHRKKMRREHKLEESQAYKVSRMKFMLDELDKTCSSLLELIREANYTVLNFGKYGTFEGGTSEHFDLCRELCRLDNPPRYSPETDAYYMKKLSVSSYARLGRFPAYIDIFTEGLKALRHAEKQAWKWGEFASHLINEEQANTGGLEIPIDNIQKHLKSINSGLKNLSESLRRKAIVFKVYNDEYQKPLVELILASMLTESELNAMLYYWDAPAYDRCYDIQLSPKSTVYTPSTERNPDEYNPDNIGTLTGLLYLLDSANDDGAEKEKKRST